MTKDESQQIIRSDGSVMSDMFDRLKLIFRLMADRRVPSLYKLLPIGSLIYLISPDLVIGPFDDALIIWMGSFFFVELCPDDIVQEHMQEIQMIEGEIKDVDEDVIDADFEEMN
jgi:hypothetical protein